MENNDIKLLINNDVILSYKNNEIKIIHCDNILFSGNLGNCSCNFLSAIYFKNKKTLSFMFFKIFYSIYKINMLDLSKKNNSSSKLARNKIKSFIKKIFKNTLIDLYSLVFKMDSIMCTVYRYINHHFLTFSFFIYILFCFFFLLLLTPICLLNNVKKNSFKSF